MVPVKINEGGAVVTAPYNYIRAKVTVLNIAGGGLQSDLSCLFSR